MIKHLRRLFLPLVAFAALSGCDVSFKAGNFDEDKTMALTAVQEYRALHNQEDYSELYDLASPALKAAVSKDDFMSAARGATDQYGKYRSSVLVGSSCLPNEVRLVYDTEFEKAKVRELMTWSVAGSKAELSGYEVLANQAEFHKDRQVGCPVP